MQTVLFSFQILRALTKETGTLFKYNETAEGISYGLINLDLTQIKPTYEAMGKTGTTKQNDGMIVVFNMALIFRKEKKLIFLLIKLL